MLIKGNFVGFKAKERWGRLSHSQGKGRKGWQLSVLELLGEYFNLANFYPNWRDGMYPACLDLSWTQP